MYAVPIRITVLVALLAVTGCFRYQPSTVEATPGVMLRLQLTESAAERLTSVLGAHASTVDGRLVAVSEGGYVVSVSRVVRDGVAITWAGEEVVVPRDAISIVERRVLDRRRTFATAGVAVVAAVLIGKLARSAGGGSPGDAGGGNPSP